MCIIFGDEPVHVAKTSLYAVKHNHQQTLVYQLSLEQAKDAVMVLPLPVASNDFSFIDLSDYPDFFSDLSEVCQPNYAMLDFGSACREVEQTLVVETIGQYHASFAPSIDKLHYLDEQFQLTDEVWQALSHYKGYGFAVFQLKPDADISQFHPMAMCFESFVDELFYPTVHIHDKHFHDLANFDHTIYCQIDNVSRAIGQLMTQLNCNQWFFIDEAPIDHYRTSHEIVAKVLANKAMPDFIQGDKPVHALDLHGEFANIDICL